jgi:hypothetical protein
MIIRVHTAARKHHDIRHKAMPGMALAHQQFRPFAGLSPDNQARGIAWPRGAGARAAFAFCVGTTRIIGG